MGHRSLSLGADTVTSSHSTLGDTRARLEQDLRALADDAEALLRQTLSQASELDAQARSRLQSSLDAARTSLGQAQQQVVDTALQAARATDDYVQHKPWQAVGIAAGVGLVLGLLIGRK